MTWTAARPARPARAAVPAGETAATPPWLVRTAVVASLLWLALLALYQLDAGGRLVVVPGLALAPLLASLVLGWRTTGALAACAVTVVVALSARVGPLGSSDAVLRIGGSAATAGFAVLNAAVRRRREQRLARLSQVAEVAQGAILHAVPPELAGFSLATRYVSASQDALVGGDLYDVVETSRGLRVLVGDVRGKGLPAVRTAAEALSAFRQLAPRVELRLVDVAASLEQALRPGLGEEDFVTAVLCELGPAGALEVVNCGHPAPLHLPCQGPAHELAPSVPSPPLGCGAVPHADRHVLGAGERLLLFTDGLSEARNGAGAFFRPADHADRLRAPQLQKAVDGLLAAATAHAGGHLHDDLAVVLLGPTGACAPPAPAAQVPAPAVPRQAG